MQRQLERQLYCEDRRRRRAVAQRAQLTLVVAKKIRESYHLGFENLLPLPMVTDLKCYRWFRLVVTRVTNVTLTSAMLQDCPELCRGIR